MKWQHSRANFEEILETKHTAPKRVKEGSSGQTDRTRAGCPLFLHLRAIAEDVAAINSYSFFPTEAKGDRHRRGY